MVDSAHKLVELLIKSRLDGFSESTRIVETHISIVMLTSKYAYKLKKPVNFGFVDFSSLEKRKFYCEEEVRLNKRLAEDLYIGVIPVTGSVLCPVLGGDGDVIEYLVKMHRFKSDAELNVVVERHVPVTRQFVKFAEELALFHRDAPVAGTHSPLGQSEQIVNDVKGNFSALRSANFPASILNRVAKVCAWTDVESRRLCHTLDQRQKQGFIRECHGDLHLGNLVLLNDKIVAFDCLEFSPELRWVDVASELAFLLMDLSRVRLDAVSSAVLNRYLECTSDYAVLVVLRYYMVYRALVRAKVSFLGVEIDSSSKEVELAIEPYLCVAEKTIAESGSTPSLIVTYGLSGSGKSWVSKKLAHHPGVIHIRSDMVRKVMGNEFAGVPDTDKYSSDSRRKVYIELENIACEILSAGYSVIVDATFLNAKIRKRFQELASKNGVNYHILQLNFPLTVLESRIRKRREQGGDPSEADLVVLHDQIEQYGALTVKEEMFATTINEHSNMDKNGITELAEKLNLI